MLLTKENDYGVRIIRALAAGEKLSVEAICGAERIPAQFAYKILKKLTHAGLVESKRGREGGYRLRKALSSFTLHDVMAAIDKDLFIFECLRDDITCSFKEAVRPCKVHKELRRLQKVLVEEMQFKSMHEVLNSS